MGELILGRKDDGTLEVIRADDEIEIGDQFLDDIPTDPKQDIYLRNDVLRISASNGFLAYVLTEHDGERKVWRCVRTADHAGR